MEKRASSKLTSALPLCAAIVAGVPDFNWVATRFYFIYFLRQKKRANLILCAPKRRSVANAKRQSVREKTETAECLGHFVVVPQRTITCSRHWYWLRSDSDMENRALWAERVDSFRSVSLDFLAARLSNKMFSIVWFSFSNSLKWENIQHEVCVRNALRLSICYVTVSISKFAHQSFVAEVASASNGSIERRCVSGNDVLRVDHINWILKNVLTHHDAPNGACCAAFDIIHKSVGHIDQFDSALRSHRTRYVRPIAVGS